MSSTYAATLKSWIGKGAEKFTKYEGDVVMSKAGGVAEELVPGETAT